MAGANRDLGEALAGLLAPIVREAVAEALAELGGTSSRPALLTREQLARELGCCARTVARLEVDGLPRVMLGDSPRYELEAVLAWLRGRERAPDGVIELRSKRA